MIETNLFRLGAAFSALMDEYATAKACLSALQDESDREAAQAAIGYGSSAWSAHRFARTGPAVHLVNQLYETLEDLAQDIGQLKAESFAGLLIKARAHQFAGNPAAIITEIETLALNGAGLHQSLEG